MIIATEQNFNDVYNILKEAFPPTERRNKKEQLNLFLKKEYKIHLDSYSPSVFMAVWNFNEFVFLEHFAVKKEMRGQNIGSNFFKEFIKDLDKTLIFEVEPPSTEIAIKRILFYESLGAVLNEFDYIQPPLQKKHPSIPLKIMSYPTPISQSEFNKYKQTIFKYVYNL